MGSAERVPRWGSLAREFDRDRDPIEFGRIISLSDNVFGVSLTLLVISIAITPGLSADALGAAIRSLIPTVAIIAVSIGVVGSAWLEHHRLFGRLQRVDGRLVSLNIVHLGLIAFIPLPHQFLGLYGHEPIAYVFYAGVLGAVNTMELVLFLYARRARLFRVEPSLQETRAEAARHLVVTAGCVLSMPLAYVLLGLTPIIWITLLPLARLVVVRQQGVAP
jgi:uncharacterized membrane protein